MADIATGVAPDVAPDEPTDVPTDIATPVVSPFNRKMKVWPALGLTLIENFITVDEEKAMIAAFELPDDAPPKKRLSKHFGYHFDYTTFGASETTLTPVPEYIQTLLHRLPIQMNLPDQFTVQYYPPGAGIPPHVDTHSMFEEALYSLSYGSAVPMMFKKAGKNEARKLRLPKRSLGGEATGGETAAGEAAAGDAVKEDEEEEEGKNNPVIEVLLPPRSLLVMMGASRYGYVHGIRSRKTDVIRRRTVPRTGRYSITMRTVRRGDEIRCDCYYPGVCDARVREEEAERQREKERTDNGE
ncbi:hypothetical protein OQA88_13495 [Cercophora sp. LCS_1]